MSFLVGTPVYTVNGICPIETIHPGDLVWSYDEETGEIALKEVLQTVEREVDVTVKLAIGDETIETTAEHPFYTADGWKDAAELETGELIRRKDDEQAPVLSVDFDYTPKKVFNFEVADWHTYFVGVFAWLVHNSKRCLDDAGKAALRILREAYEKEVKNLSNIVDAMKMEKCSPEEIARTVHALRREIGRKYKDLTPKEIRDQIYERNLKKYGDELGPSIEWLKDQGKSWEQIIESAIRPDGSDLKKTIGM